VTAAAVPQLTQAPDSRGQSGAILGLLAELLGAASLNAELQDQLGQLLARQLPIGQLLPALSELHRQALPSLLNAPRN